MVNIGNMMKQAQQLQKKMAEAQQKLNDIEVEGESGGGLVKVVATAKGSFKRISIDDSLVKLDEKEILEFRKYKHQGFTAICINFTRQKTVHKSRKKMGESA